MFTPNTHTIIKKIVAHKRLSLLVESKDIWASNEDLAKVFWIELTEVISLIHEYYLSADNDIQDTMKKVYNEEIDHYENYYNLEVVIGIGYRLWSYKVVREFVRLRNSFRTYSPINSSEWDDLDIDNKIQVVSKALELIKYMREWQNHLVH